MDDLMIRAKKIPEYDQETGHPASRRVPQARPPRRRDAQPNHFGGSRTMPRIFVSHAAKDEGLVEEFVELLQVGVGIHPDDVFCSSLPGMDIPTGRAFIEYIKSQVQNPELVLLIVWRSS